jgi:rsbT co-antagonist protein RsbR
MNGKNTRTRKGRSDVTQATPESTAALLRELVAHLRENRTQLREEWARRITES